MKNVTARVRSCISTRQWIHGLVVYSSVELPPPQPPPPPASLPGWRHPPLSLSFSLSLCESTPPPPNNLKFTRNRKLCHVVHNLTDTELLAKCLTSHTRAHTQLRHKVECQWREWSVVLTETSCINSVSQSVRRVSEEITVVPRVWTTSQVQCCVWFNELIYTYASCGAFTALDNNNGGIYIFIIPSTIVTVITPRYFLPLDLFLSWFFFSFSPGVKWVIVLCPLAIWVTVENV